MEPETLSRPWLDKVNEKREERKKINIKAGKNNIVIEENVKYNPNKLAASVALANDREEKWQNIARRADGFPSDAMGIEEFCKVDLEGEQVFTSTFVDDKSFYKDK